MSLLVIRISHQLKQNRYLAKGLVRNYLFLSILILLTFFAINYTLSVSANNSDDVIRVNVSADSWVESNNANTNYGSDTVLYVKNTSDPNKKQTFLRFDLSGIPPAQITSATLNLYSTSSSSTFLVYLSVYSVADDSWDEYS